MTVGPARRRLMLAVVSAGLAGAAAAALWAAGGGGTGRTERRSVAGIVLPSLGGPGRVDLASLAVQPLVVNYFASWCPFCAAEMPGFQRVYTSLGGQVGFVGIALSDDPQAAAGLAAQTGVSYPLAEDPGGDSYRRFGAVGMPVTVFVAAGGRVLEVFEGPLSEHALRARIRRHFSR